MKRRLMLYYIYMPAIDGHLCTGLTFKDISMRGTTEPIQVYVGARSWARRPGPTVVGSMCVLYINQNSAIEDEDSSMILQSKMKILLMKNDVFRTALMWCSR